MHLPAMVGLVIEQGEEDVRAACLRLARADDAPVADQPRELLLAQPIHQPDETLVLLRPGAAELDEACIELRIEAGARTWPQGEVSRRPWRRKMARATARKRVLGPL